MVRPLAGRLTFALAVATALAAAPAAAQPESCRLALALALDVSSSVDSREYALQSRGLAAALDSTAVRDAILNGAPGRVALAAFEWSGRRQQVVVVDWTILRSNQDIDRVIATLAGAERSYAEFPTALGYALGYGAILLTRAPPCDRRVLDVSGDGENNDGFAPLLAFKHFPFAGITVNGLAIEVDGDSPENYYWRHVVRGPGAFVERAEGFAGFERAMQRKLLREINDLQIGMPGPHGAGPG